jgi:hypothetical protein
MVRAVLDGRKTQTRRVTKLDKINEHPDYWKNPLVQLWDKIASHLNILDQSGKAELITCPYGKPGDRLWVRETWRETGSLMRVDGKIPECGNDDQVVYRADADYDGPFRPSIHMPRWASRIQLEITAIRVERVQDISEEDALAEGIRLYEAHGVPEAEWKRYSPVIRFSALWDSINEARGFGWSTNPWVWVVEFKVIAQ